MKVSMLVISLLLLVPSCGPQAPDKAEHPKPQLMCIAHAQGQPCGRYGICYECLERGIACPKPTVLTEGQGGKLTCRLVRP
jgi:hypothetical protein